MARTEREQPEDKQRPTEHGVFARPHGDCAHGALAVGACGLTPGAVRSILDESGAGGHRRATVADREANRGGEYWTIWLPGRSGRESGRAEPFLTPNQNHKAIWEWVAIKPKPTVGSAALSIARWLVSENKLERVNTPSKAQQTEAGHATTRPVRQELGNLPPPLVSAPLGQGEIILVLGVPMKRGFVGGILRQLGYRVMEAAHMTEAQSLADSEPVVHLLLLDFTVIDTRHLEFALWFRSTYPETKVLVLSYSLWELDFHLGVTQKFALLARPFTPLELARVVRRTLD